MLYSLCFHCNHNIETTNCLVVVIVSNCQTPILSFFLDNRTPTAAGEAYS